MKKFTEQNILKAIQEIASQKTKLAQDQGNAAKQDQVATVFQDQEIIRGREIIASRDQRDIKDQD